MRDPTVLVIPGILEGIIDKIELESDDLIVSILDLNYEISGIVPEKSCIILFPPRNTKLIRLIPKVEK